MTAKLMEYQQEKRRLSGLGRGKKPAGDIRDLAARKVGLSGRSAEKGLAVLLAIGGRQGAPDCAAGCHDLSLMLENSIDAAHKRARTWKWLPRRVGAAQSTVDEILRCFQSTRRRLGEVLETAPGNENPADIQDAIELGIQTLSDLRSHWLRRERTEAQQPAP